MIGALFSLAIRILTGVNVYWRCEHLPARDQPKVYFANHTSHFDFLLIWAVLPKELRRQTRPVAARDYWTRGVLRKWLASVVFQAALIERNHITKGNNPVGELGEILRNKGSLILFPEGTRGDGVRINPFKSGLYHLASKHPETEFVPVYLDNLNRVLPKGELLPVPLICSVRFGESIRLQPEESKSDFLLRARKSIEALSQTS